MTEETRSIENGKGEIGEKVGERKKNVDGRKKGRIKRKGKEKN